MKILVTVKRVIDYNVQVRVKGDGSGVEKENVKMSMNPPDENAVEEALRIKEAGKAEEIIILSIGAKALAVIISNTPMSFFSVNVSFITSVFFNLSACIADFKK